MEEKIKIINGIEHKEHCIQTDKSVRCNIFNVSEFGREMEEWTKEFLNELVD